MSVSLTSARSNPNRRITVVRITPPATITSPRPGAMTGSAARSDVVMPMRSSRTRSAAREREPGPVDRLGVVAIEAERDRLERRRGPGHGDQRARVADGHVRLGVIEHLVDRDLELRELVGRRRVVTHEPLGQANAAHPRGDRVFRAARLGADDELGGPAADVEHQVRRRRGRGSSRCVPPRNDRPASRSPLITSSSLPVQLEDGRGELLAVLRVADGARGRHADAFRVQGPGPAAKRASTSTVRWSASGSIRPVRSTPWPSRVMTMSRASSVGSSPSRNAGSTTSSRIEFVP